MPFGTLLVKHVGPSMTWRIASLQTPRHNHCLPKIPYIHSGFETLLLL